MRVFFFCSEVTSKASQQFSIILHSAAIFTGRKIRHQRNSDRHPASSDNRPDSGDMKEMNVNNYCNCIAAATVTAGNNLYMCRSTAPSIIVFSEHLVPSEIARFSMYFPVSF